jgi:Transposase IS200 like
MPGIGSTSLMLHARQTRYELIDVPQHIIQQGNNRQPTFFADEDYQLYLECPADAAKHQACDIHPYVLMTNHVHLPGDSTSAAGCFQADAVRGAEGGLRPGNG